ncbi:MAG: hypothetical protein ABI864_01220 [Chloroflexota bacterium]
MDRARERPARAPLHRSFAVLLAALSARVHASHGAVVLRSGAQDAGVRGQVGLFERGHHAALASLGDQQSDLVANCQGSQDPSVLHEAGLAVGRGEADVGSKATRVEATLGIQLAEPIEGGGRQQVDDPRVEECAGLHRRLRYG